MIKVIAPIVEGHGEVAAVPELLRRLAAEITPEVLPQVNPPIRIKVGSFLHDHDYFSQYVALAPGRQRKAERVSC